MTNTRLAKLYEELEAIKSLLKEIQEDEQEAFDSIPENLEATTKDEKAEEAIDNLDAAVNALEDALEYIKAA